MRVAIHGRSSDKNLQPILQDMLKVFEEHEVEVWFSEIFAQEHSHLVQHHSHQVYSPYRQSGFDLHVSLGGDGTFLETLTHVGMSETPMIGINTGRLGFLANTAMDEVRQVFEKYFAGNYTIDRRSLVAFESNLDLFDGINYGLNEFAVLRKETSSMIVIKAYLDGKFISTYWADGLMIATPTGSTGYSLSCGGPILLPHTSNFVLTPVSPHNLNIRPLIVPDSSEISLQVESRSASFLVSLDSRSRSAEGDIKLRIKKAPFYANLVRPEGLEFVETLRNKLSWGYDKRN